MRILLVSQSLFPSVLRGPEVAMHRLLERLRSKHGFIAESREWRPHLRIDLAALIRDAAPDWVFARSAVAPEVVWAAKAEGRRVALFIDDPADLFCARLGRVPPCLDPALRPEPFECSARCPAASTNSSRVAPTVICRGGRAARGLSRRVVALWREALTAADLVVCNSDYPRRVIDRAFGPPRLIVQRPLVEFPTERDGMRRRYLTVIRPTAERGQHLFERLVRTLSDHEFLVVAPPDDLDIPWRSVASLPVAVQMAEIWRASRILLRPALVPESFALTVAEAAAFGVPSIVSGLGGLPEAVADGGCAVADFDRLDAWLDAIRQVEGDYDRCSDAALQHAQSFNSAEPIVEALQDSNQV